MADIVSWSPIDDNNNAAPPDGWPEGQMPSTANNCARAMMGGIRRWYDTVTAQLAMISTAFGNYLPLTGGTLTGTLSAPQYNINGIPFVNSDGTTTNINDPTGSGLAALQLQSFNIYYNSDVHYFRNNAGSLTATTINGLGDLSAARDISAGRNIAASAGVVTAGSVHSTATIQADTHITATGTLTGGYVHSTGNIQVDGTLTGGAVTVTGNVTGANFIGNVSVPASGPISTGGTITGGTVSGGTVTSTGNINAAGGISAGGFVSAQGYQTRAGTAGVATGNYFNIEWRPGAHLWVDNVHQGTFVLDGGGGITTSNVYSSGGYTTTGPNGDPTFQMVSITGYSYIRFLPNWYWQFNASGDSSSGAMVWFIDRSGPKEFWYMRASDSMCLNYLGPVAGLGAYVNTSDRRGKKNIAPSRRGLAEVLELTPVEFNRISDVDTPREIGFVAQDVKDVMPEAVRVVGINLPDGTGGLGDPEPTLGLTDSTIVAALVNAVKTLNARIATLEEVRHE